MSGAKSDLSVQGTGRRLADAFADSLGRKTPPGPEEVAFLDQMAADLQAEELPPVSDAGLAAMFAEFWQFAVASGDRDPAIRLRRWTDPHGRDLGRDLLEIVQEDRPFLVDSIMGQITELGLAVRAMFHPVVDSGGKVRSLIQVHLDPVGEDRVQGLIDAVADSLADVVAAVEDFTAMKDLMRRTIDEFEATPLGGADPDERAEQLTFLRWLEGEHFVFLGSRVYEYPRTEDGGYAAQAPLHQPEDNLGVLRDQSRAVLRRANEPAVLSTQVRRHLESGPALTVAKSNLRSRVHRRAYMDYVGVKRYGDDGLPSGEVRFVGLFTAEAYETPAHEAPLIRRKVRLALAAAQVLPGGHSEKRLRNIIETYPRDELFQMGEDELLDQATGILHLYDRPRLKLFARKDPFDRFFSVLLFVPRDRYDSGLRERAGQLIAAAYGGRVSAYYPSFSDSPLARVHYIIGVTPGDHADPDLAALEAEVAEAARTWGDRFEAAVRASGLPTTPALQRWAGAFSGGYRDFYPAEEALADLGEVDAMAAAGDDFRVRAFRKVGDSAMRFRFKLYRRGEHVPLADVTPILEHMGLRALIEDAFELTPVTEEGTETVWVHEFLLEDRAGEHLVFADIKAAFEALFTAVWLGRTESDGFNRLVLELGVSWREAALVRALARYRLQSGLDPSQSVQEQALADNPGVARLILDLFRVKFDTAIAVDNAARLIQAEAVMGQIVEALQAVESLDADRALRRLALLVMAIKRTNFYQLGKDGDHKPYISFKIASRELDDLPDPKPYREIFVWSPQVEGVHLRFGPVARGGLRWSDRRDDFRTEVLGLVKAQQVKNAVIVPVGSKGGFYPKQLPRGGAPDQVRAAGVAAYTTFLSGLLDITDNINADNEVIHPAGVIVHEGDDPYLVVAADKGTATFSDIANGIAESYGFWLGDAFASGGSAGYDHKVMGITARGAWEAVKRHFREMGKDIQKEPFTVVGVGDMSGDVFGNGMLLSRHTRLLAAFDHRHIFIDPDPDPKTSYAERERMFALPRSSWDDYDRAAISQGGGVFARSLKSIPLTPEIKAAFDIKADKLSPAELMTAILKSRAELLYLGGIGTYVKARRESQHDAGDKANDAIRIDGADLRVKVVGEGANLGLTQAGRIEFARNGGRINTDAIDNSAGVDSSDHEVNIKILTGMVERAGNLTRTDRNKLLVSMTDDVAAHVLAHNYDQTLALSLLQQDAAGEVDNHARFMAELEADGKLDRRVEGLPDALTLQDMAKAGQGLSRPELAVLLAYGKLDLFSDMVAGKGPDDPAFQATLEAYFPAGLRKYDDEMRRHRLRREIIATVLSNQIVNRCGPTFASRLKASAGADDAALVIGFEAGRRVLGVDALWDQVAALDGKAPAQGQLALFRALSHLIRSQTYWMARRAKTGEGVQALVDRYRPAVQELAAVTPAILSPFEQKAVARRAKAFLADGAPEALAQAVASLQPLTTAADLIDVAASMGWPAAAAARLYHQVGAAFNFDKLRAAAGEKRGGDHYERMAVRRLIEDMLGEQTAVTRAVMTFATNAQAGETPEQARQTVNSWASIHSGPGRAVRRTVEEIESAGGGWTFAKLTIANAALRELAEAAGRGRG